ncbi:hypothetical protein Y032_0581g283 [Ancylostoma ceylanicum]|nr:hypothetical protein Y032_0581g283 [Ancylostoma ceylanicum]
MFVLLRKAITSWQWSQHVRGNEAVASHVYLNDYASLWTSIWFHTFYAETARRIRKPRSIPIHKVNEM